MKRPDPRTHKLAHLYSQWDDPHQARRAEAGERLWWSLTGAFVAFMLWMAARVIQAWLEGRLG